MKTIYTVTSSRADYGILHPLLKLMEKETTINHLLLVTGTHLSKKFGLTLNEIKKEKINSYKCIKIPVKARSIRHTAETLGVVINRFSHFFSKNRPDAVLILGDRFEILGIAISATLNNIPLIHLHGGELSYGSIDDSFRHSITKMSHLHFASTETYRQRIIQMGENPDFVYNTGSLAVESIKKISFIGKSEIEKKLNIKLREKYALVTVHPETSIEKSSLTLINSVLESVKKFPDVQFIFTGTNMDTEGEIINRRIRDFVRENPHCLFFSSLGFRLYFSLIKGAEFCLGNSSSGILEVPSFHIPTINIGSRQDGRLKADSVIDIPAEENKITETIKGFLINGNKIIQKNNPYEKENTKYLMLDIIRRTDFSKLFTKKFHDIPISEFKNNQRGKI